MKIYIPITIISIALFSLLSCKSSNVSEIENTETLIYNPNGQGQQLIIDFQKGPEHNHPLMAIWISDENNNYIQTLYVAESIGKGIFDHGDATSGKWLPKAIRRPGALPVWSHSRGVSETDGLYIPTPEHAIADAYSGPTPRSSFKLQTKTDSLLSGKINVYFEINQTWDWNEYWTNNKYPDDEVYKTSCQPSLIYKATIDLSESQAEYEMQVIGRGHHSGKTGEIYKDLETMTTALEIVEKIKISTR